MKRKWVPPNCIPLHQTQSRSVICEADDICSRHHLNLCYTLHVHLTIAYDRCFRLFIFLQSLSLFSVNVVNLSSLRCFLLSCALVKLLLRWSNWLLFFVVRLSPLSFARLSPSTIAIVESKIELEWNNYGRKEEKKTTTTTVCRSYWYHTYAIHRSWWSEWKEKSARTCVNIQNTLCMQNVWSICAYSCSSIEHFFSFLSLPSFAQFIFFSFFFLISLRVESILKFH